MPIEVTHGRWVPWGERLTLTSRNFIRFAVPVAGLFALLAVVLPSDAGARYAQIAHASAIGAAALLALWVALFYRASMRAAFLLLGGFLVLYSPTTSSWLVEEVAEALGANFLRVLLAYQVLDYALLLSATVIIVRLMDVRRLSRGGWFVAAAGLATAAVFVVNGLSTVRELLDFSTEAGSIYLIIRVFDASVLTMMVPVVWLYVQNARSKYQENATFTLVIVGIILSLTMVYLYEFVKGDPLTVIAASEYQAGSPLDALYLFGYLVIGIGLFAHRKHQEWSFNRLDDFLEAVA